MLFPRPHRRPSALAVTSRTRTAVVLLATLAVVVAGCSGSGGGDQTPTTTNAPADADKIPADITGPDGSRLFTGAGNPWTTPVPDDTAPVAGSDRYVQKLLTERPLVSVSGWTIPVYDADAATPKYTVTASEDHTGHGGWILPDVPVPANAKPDPQEDGHMVVVDRQANCLYEFWQARKEGSGWGASWINATPADGDGIYPDGISARAAGISAGAGLIWPQELAAGEIDHALVFAYPYTRSGGPVAPATSSDGTTDGADALPEGARLRLDPSIDVDSLGLPPAQTVIAKALQKYGMILADTSGGFTLYAASPQSFESFPYPQSWTHDLWKDVSDIPFDALQVVDDGPQFDKHDGPPITNRCNQAVQQPPLQDDGGGDGGDDD
ncbi:hypothetical protein PSU4_34530 [Pseudonocardia sulfidoxydans NBRC 16205]|uniref:Uncharacterized protein n=2 Tax=Pseudonocardia sulfidoxydans TaxID=54011 RepID=A0A511DI69_9PSEU|nr:hypothetical protein [Pseudonocardia sulfidoxydans]GEL24499.1 hypothetical protein PSU4_34530 [Pseudonocardia sulfidoxydans NBRC 16205]